MTAALHARYEDLLTDYDAEVERLIAVLANWIGQNPPTVQADRTLRPEKAPP